MTASLASIHALDLAELRLPKGHPSAGQRCLVRAFLIAHSDGAILVDSGVGQGSELIERMYQPQRRDLLEQIEALGFSADDVTALVNTHLHFDHCGGNSRFPGRPIYVQQAEYAASRDLYYTVREWVDFEDVHWRFVDGEREIASGVRLLPTPGHTPGHQSVLVESAGRRDLICGQAAYTSAEFAAQPDDGEAAEGMGKSYRASFAKLHELGAQRVYFSHDPIVWTPPGAPG